MLLTEITQQHQQLFAWFEPADGPNDIKGIRLAFIDPIDPKISKYLKIAKLDNNEKQIDRLTNMRKQYEKSGQTYWIGSLGWWMNKKEFDDSMTGVGGGTKEQIFAQHPGLTIFNSKQEAITAAKKAGII